jgi:hypothetical protein
MHEMSLLSNEGVLPHLSLLQKCIGAWAQREQLAYIVIADLRKTNDIRGRRRRAATNEIAKIVQSLMTKIVLQSWEIRQTGAKDVYRYRYWISIEKRRTG